MNECNLIKIFFDNIKNSLFGQKKENKKGKITNNYKIKI